MTVLHHLDDSTLVSYASGNLDEAFSVVVAAHIAMCPECRAELHAAEDIGGQMLEEAGEAELSGDAFERIMACIDGEGSAVTPIRRPSVSPSSHHAKAGGDVPLPLRRFIGGDLDSIPWKTVAPGVLRHKIALETDTPSSLYMLHIAPGKAVPEHGHGGAEMTLILSGAYRDEMGVFGPGDIADLDEHVEHQPKVEPGAPCICLVATEAPTKFKGVFSRLMQPFVGI